MTDMTYDQIIKLATRARDDAGSLSDAEVEALGTWIVDHVEPWSEGHYPVAGEDLVEGDAD